MPQDPRFPTSMRGDTQKETIKEYINGTDEEVNGFQYGSG